MKTLLVTGTDTGVGKTWISCILIQQLMSKRMRIGAYKPACSGAEFSADGIAHWTDVDSLAAACDHSGDPDLVCPQRFIAPLAPPLAAVQEGRAVDEQLLISGLDRWQGKADLVVVEGAGGLLCPMSDRLTVADLASTWKTPLVLVVANRLGLINHTLLSLEVAARRGLSVSAVVLNDVTPDDYSAATNPNLLAQWIGSLPFFRCFYRENVLKPQNQQAETLEWGC